MVCAPDLHGYVRTPWCADTLVCAERALVGHPRRMDVCVNAGRPVGAGGSSPLSQRRGHARARARADFHVPPLSNAHELGDMRSSCSPPCPPPGTCPERLCGGRQVVPRRVQVACTIASMGQAGAGVRGANSDMRGGGKLPPPRDLRVRSHMPRGWSWATTNLRANPDMRGGANLAPPRDLGFYRTSDAPLARSRTGEQTDNNGSARLAGPYDLAGARGPIGILGPGVDVGVGHRLPHRTTAARSEVRKAIHATRSTDPQRQTGKVRSRRFGGTVLPGRTPRCPTLDLPRAGLDVDLHRRPSHYDPSADPSSG